MKNNNNILEFSLLVFIAFFILLVVQYTNIAQRWNFLIYDSLQNIPETKINNDIAIIAVDNHSLKSIGMWPWSRSIHAELLGRLNSVKPKVVAFDILFTDTDSRYTKGDSIFAKAIKNNGRVVLPALQLKSQNPDQSIELHLPIPLLAENAAQIAHVDAEIDPDGLVRRVFLKAGINQRMLSTLGLSAIEVAQFMQYSPLPGMVIPKPAKADNNWVRNNQILLSQANPKAFKTYSYVDVLNNDNTLRELKNKIIFVGVTASGVATHLPIANSNKHSMVSSVYYHASIANALLNHTAITPLKNLFIYAIGIFIFFILTSIFFHSRPGTSLLATLIFICLTVVGSYFLLQKYHVWAPPAAIIISLLVSYPLWSWRRLLVMTKQLTQEKDRAEVTLRSIADGVITLGQSGKVLYMNPIAEQLTGVLIKDAYLKPIESIFHINDKSTDKKITHNLIQYLKSENKTTSHESYTLTNKYGKRYAIRATLVEIENEGNGDSGIVLAFSDVTETIKMFDRMSHQATHDTLTNLPNRSLLMESLNHSLAIADRHNRQIALLFIDVDKFKNINDGFGHETGDRLLMEIAKRLKSSVRDEDIVARLGGDEFVIVLDQIAKSSNITIVTQKLLEHFEQPITLSNHTFYVTCSIGISIYPKDAVSAEALLKNADIAMYSAKDRGRNNSQYFSASMNEVVQNRLMLEKELRRALKYKQLKLFYQPQVNVKTRKITGVEALLRWEHDKFGTVSPSQFIPLAEETGLIIPIGEWVLRSACSQIKLWNRFIDDDFTLAVNLSPRQFLGQNILTLLKDVIESENISARQLKLEITESIFVSEKNNVEETLEEFRNMGGTVSIDDFGTGYSSLSYLQRIPVDQVKIDRFFVQDIEENSRSRSLIKAIISIAHDMELDVIAEGVESAEQLQILEEQNCFSIQGFYFSPAVEAEKITDLFKNENAFLELESL